ncbi:hypothetical protein FRB96_004638 [Tulasnella sp. 330]|nr:hypothetical protein FRB96_004638 [Tulasnella sp. 330]
MVQEPQLRDPPPPLSLLSTSPPTTSMTSEPFSAFEQLTFESSLARCLEKYHTILLGLDSDNSDHNAGVFDPIQLTSQSSQSSNDAVPVPQNLPFPLPHDDDAVQHADMHLEIWTLAAEACGCVPDGFMSLQRPKPASKYASTSLDTMIDEQGQHEAESRTDGLLGDRMCMIMEESEEEIAAELAMEKEKDMQELEMMGASDDEDTDEDSEMDDEAQEAMLARSRSRRSSFAYANSTPTTSTPDLNTVTPTTPLPSSPPPQPTDPEGLWAIRAPEWSWTPRHPSTPSMSLTPPPEDALYPPLLHNTYAWTPLQSARCIRTGREQLPVRQTYVFNNDARRHPECLTCSEGYSGWVRESLRESWGVCEDEMDEMCSGVVGMPVDDQRGWGLHARVWQHSLGNCMCKELEGWYTPEHTPGQGQHHDDDEEGEEEEEEGYEEILDAMQQPGYEGMMNDTDDTCSASEWDELSTPAGGAAELDLPDQDDKPVLTLAMEIASATVFVNPEEEVDRSSPVISSRTLLPLGSLSSMTASSPKTPRWMDLDEEDLEELPDLSDW